MAIKLETLRHSLSHVLAYAVKELYPGVKFGIGPVIENGFYYDFDFSKSKESPKEKDLPRIEEKMREIINSNLPFKKESWNVDKALKFFREQNQGYKVELIKDLKKKGEKYVSIYKLGDFIDLCKGPHIKSTKEINCNAFKLNKIAGAYWKGDEKNSMLVRIYGLGFETKKQLNDFIEKQKQAEEVDHRILGKKLELFIFDKDIGAGLPLWLPKGAILYHIIENYLYEELLKEKYQWVKTPHIANIKLWEISGHLSFYKESMYSPIKIDDEKYQLKPMNCPFHLKIYRSKIRSWRDMPLKFAELGTVYRYEKSGVLHGLTRVRGFTQDDAHIFCTTEQLSNELTKILNHGLKILKTFGFKNYKVYLSTRPEKYIGTLKYWEKATRALKYALNKKKIKYEIDPEGGVFYGPKIDIKIRDNLEREWQCTTIQVDFNLPEKFDISYIDKKGNRQRPIMIHRALLGSVERFIGVLLEHYKGDLPLWLSPVQIWVIPVGASHRKYATEINRELLCNNFRVEVRDENETVSKKIRDGEIQKIPYILVVGDKEMKSNSVRIRTKNKDIGMMKLRKFIEKAKKEIDKKK